VQSVARDLLGHWVLECERFGLPVVLHVHDEVVTLIKKGIAVELLDDDLLELNNILCSLPAWAEGLPTAAEIKESNVYTK